MQARSLVLLLLFGFIYIVSLVTPPYATYNDAYPVFRPDTAGAETTKLTAYLLLLAGFEGHIAAAKAEHRKGREDKKGERKGKG